MRCDKARDLLLSDHMDGEAHNGTGDKVDRHLMVCEECRMFYSELKEKVRVPFRGLEPVEPPARVWKNIRSRIYEEPEKKKLFGIPRIPVGELLLKRPVLLFATIMLLVVAVGQVSRVYENNKTEDYVRTQMEFLISPSENEDAEGFGTGIEEYFL